MLRVVMALVCFVLVTSCVRDAHPLPLLSAGDGYMRQIKDQCDTQPQLDWCRNG